MRNSRYNNHSSKMYKWMWSSTVLLTNVCTFSAVLCYWQIQRNIRNWTPSIIHFKGFQSAFVSFFNRFFFCCCSSKNNNKKENELWFSTTQPNWIFAFFLFPSQRIVLVRYFSPFLCLFCIIFDEIPLSLCPKTLSHSRHYWVQTQMKTWTKQRGW